MSISSIYDGYNVTYTEWGRCAKPKDNPDSKVGIYWGKEFEEKLKTTLAQTAAEQTEAAENAPPRAKLTDDDIKELASKYCQRRYEIVRKRRRNFVVFRR